MCQLLETIKVDNGQLFNIDYHNQRMNEARRELFPGCATIDLSTFIQIPENCNNGLFRCRVVYARGIESVEFIPQAARMFRSLKLVEDNNIDYHLKFADRNRLNALLAQKGDADEIIIIKNGKLTDCSIGNLVFSDGQNWFTPAEPLLRGTQRQKLLDNAQIKESIITADSLKNYLEVGIVNAFFDLKNMPRIKIDNIF